MSETVMDRLIERLRDALAYNENAQVPPVALLWSDGARQWESVVPRLLERVPVLRLGDFEPGARQGPAYWVRCVVAGTISVDTPDGTPIVYMPGADRGSLRAVEACPASLAPIAELQYRGQWFSHKNGKDWTVRSFCANPEHGLGLQIADDPQAAGAMLLALDEFLSHPIERIENQQLDADFFHSLVNPDPVQNLLDWIDDPDPFKERIGDERWAAFVQQTKVDYGLDPEAAGVVTAAERLGRREDGWEQVWKRFADAPGRYPGIPERLRKARPLELVLESPATWPQDNEAGEEQLRALLLELGALTTEGARSEIVRLDEEHDWRRGTVWAELEQAPLAFALEQLNLLAEITSQPLATTGLSALVTDYVERGWRADDAVLKALAAAPDPADRDAVSIAVASVYKAWLDSGARALQAATDPTGGSYAPGDAVHPSNGVATLFVDGLRFDVAERLRARLDSAGFEPVSEPSLAALPTVTPTAKAAVVPVAEEALEAGPDFHANNAATGTKATIQVLRSLMQEHGVQVLGAAETGDPSGSAWVECGSIDQIGHDFGIRLADQIDEEVERIAARVRELLDADWPRVDVVTDHGWILLPGGMERVELPAATTEAKKGRCARIKQGAEVSVPIVSWHWDPNVAVAVAPGATCFEANKVYEHGGVSPQECIVQRLSVATGAVTRETRSAEITKVKWLGLQCRIELADVSDGVEVDIRGAPAERDTSIAEKAKETSTPGRVTLIVPDEELVGEAAYVVVLTSSGQVLAQRGVTVGRNK